jgi:hypothetical protein
MSRIRAFVSAKFVVAALVVLAAGAIYVANLPKSDAVIIGGPGVCVYYSSKNYQTAVGARGTGCCGAVINWGVTSPYVKCERLYCTDQICPN